MYINRDQEEAIREAADKIRELASLENCLIDFGKNRWQVELWLKWFAVEANRITRVLDKEEF